MKQQILFLIVSISLCVSWIDIISLTIAQHSVATPVIKNSDLAEAIWLNQQSILLYQQGKYDEAIPLSQRSISILERVFGKDHPDVAASLNNLAQLYKAQSKYDLAEPLYQRALAIRERVLGKDHPDVATSLNNLAGLYQAKGKYDLAEPLYQRSL